MKKISKKDINLIDKEYSYKIQKNKYKLPFWLCGNLLFNFGWELLLFHKLREWHDGVSFLELIINFDRYNMLEYIKFKDNPSFRIHLIVLNYTIFEFEIYKRAKTLSEQSKS
jgi:hypothetical protein